MELYMYNYCVHNKCTSIQNWTLPFLTNIFFSAFFQDQNSSVIFKFKCYWMIYIKFLLTCNFQLFLKFCCCCKKNFCLPTRVNNLKSTQNKFHIYLLVKNHSKRPIESIGLYQLQIQKLLVFLVVNFQSSTLINETVTHYKFSMRN